MSEPDPCFTPAVELARMIRERSLSSRELIDACLARIDACNGDLNAYITVDHEGARAAATAADGALAAGAEPGPLHGVPIAIKDLQYTKGLRTTGGSRLFADFVPAVDALSVARLKAAGAIVIGKTNTPEFGYKSTTENQLIGPTRNPWDRTRTAGGSSGGAAAAVAAGLAPLSLGTDAGGSIRTPASFCGVYGFKPTFGRVPDGPAFGGGRSIAHTGPITRCVADAAALLDVIAGPSERDRCSLPAVPANTYTDALTETLPPLRIGWSANLGYAPVDPEVAAVTASAVSVFETLGYQIEAADPGFSDPVNAFNTIIRAENYVFAAPLLDSNAELLEPGMREFTQQAAAISAHDYLVANTAREELCAALAEFFACYDLLVTPTLAVPPLEIGTRPGQIGGREIHGMSWLGFTYPFNLSGSPAATVPGGSTAGGLPVGLQIVGPRHADARVLQASAAFEGAHPWAQRRPGG